ncbi:MAG: KEOPS complex subunit Cgi121 [Methanosarcinales archaeon Met12]|nr:MAG: KEOPS complex subunit Cgi121 [Methanosarcinales archaeon Met12]
MTIKIIGGIAEVGDVDEFIKTMSDIARRHSVTIQALDADRTAGAEHLRFAAEKAMRSIREGRNIAEDLGLEILLYASGKRQIERALQMGISPGRNRIAIAIVGNDAERAGKDVMEFVQEAPVLDYNERKKDLIVKTFGITDAEIEAVGEGKIPELVLERVALLDIMK